MTSQNSFAKGIKDGMPIALGYLAVSFSLGIQAKEAGINAFFATLMSLLNVTSAGEFAGIGIIAASGTYLEIAVSQFIINLRYMLMSCSLSQKIDPDAPLFHRFILAFGITDEIYGISSGVQGYLKPAYTYGAMIVAIPGWTIGTCLGVIMGNILPAIIVNALSVALYGMFIAIIIPPARKNKVIAIAVVIAMTLSYICTKFPYISNLSNGTRIILLTVVISLAFAIIAPVDEDTSNDSDAANNLENQEVN